jgi:leader peptidase (prepilin peptidase)/N-methyltransferase
LAHISHQLARIDVLEHRLPNRFTLRLFVLTIPALGLALLLSQSWEAIAWAAALGLGTALLGLLLGLTGGLGLGDVKLMISLNMILGWLSPWLALISNTIAVVSAALVGVFRLLDSTPHSKQVAFGPYLLAAFFITFSSALLARIY